MLKYSSSENAQKEIDGESHLTRRSSAEEEEEEEDDAVPGSAAGTG